MKTVTAITRRSFDLLQISDEEGRVLRALLNISSDEVAKRLSNDPHLRLELEKANEMGCDICNKIVDMVDGED